MTSADGIASGSLSVDSPLRSFIEDEVLPGLQMAPERFWRGLAALINDLGPENQRLLEERARLQKCLDEWHRAHSKSHPVDEYEAFLRSIGYLGEEPAPFRIGTTGVDPEIAEIAGPQLVVPLTNARFALNAANARWCSLYDAFYGTDAVVPPPPPGTTTYDPQRGQAVIAEARAMLDVIAPLEGGSHAECTGYVVNDGHLWAEIGGKLSGLRNADSYVGHRGAPERPSAVLLRHHGLHVEIQVDRTHPVGRDDPAGIADILVEAAVSTIMDGEDSVATVDVEDKLVVYRHWLQLMQGSLTAAFMKNGQPVARSLNEDRHYTGRDGSHLRLPGRSLMLVRNVGLHVMTDMVRDGRGCGVPENIIDALVVSLIGLHDRRHRANSPAGAIYIVRPKMHGPDEVAFANDLFSRVEDILMLPRNTLKMGIMDEERRTSANLAACIVAARDRVFFINTGFLDRTGDEIRSVMEAGPVVRKQQMKNTAWFAAYERRNVQIGLRTGFPGVAQIGKGMWAAPDRMGEMMREKIAHPRSGASTAWVPSPTAAALHALHYHLVDVQACQRDAEQGAPDPVSSLLALPIMARHELAHEEIALELDNNCQGILGYVVRWVDQGVGCSKVPDIHGTGLMEDRATLRISSQHIANWLRHGIVTEAEVVSTLKRMAAIVDAQNAHDPDYAPMAPSFSGEAFEAAVGLALLAGEQPNGYTEFLLTKWRRRVKARIKDIGPFLHEGNGSHILN